MLVLATTSKIASVGEGFYVRLRHQSHGMTKCMKLARPMVRQGAGLGDTLKLEVTAFKSMPKIEWAKMRSEAGLDVRNGTLETWRPAAALSASGGKTGEVNQVNGPKRKGFMPERSDRHHPCARQSRCQERVDGHRPAAACRRQVGREVASGLLPRDPLRGRPVLSRMDIGRR